MAKIADVNIRVGTTTGNSNFRVPVNYKNGKFFVSVPKEFYPNAFLMSQEDRQKYGLVTVFKKRGAEADYAVSNDVEARAVDSLTRMIAEILNSSIVVRDVIMIRFDNSVTTWGEHRYNREHEIIGCQYGLTYAKEHRMAGEGKVMYILPNGRRLEPWKCTVIDDTPENRHVVEHIYAAMKKLIADLTGIMSTEQAMQLFIDSRPTMQLLELSEKTA